MKTPVILIVLLAVTAGARAQVPSGAKTIEGFWQDTERRILFSRDAPASYVYGGWTALDQAQTYPTAKRIARTAAGFELTDLLYGDNEHVIRIVSAKEDAIEFVRSMKFPACDMRHKCRLDGEQLFCALENICREGGLEVVDWRGEERYARRAQCERDGKRQAQGIPHRCR
jgi:hypothetical protein